MHFIIQKGAIQKLIADAILDSGALMGMSNLPGGCVGVYWGLLWGIGVGFEVLQQQQQYNNHINSNRDSKINHDLFLKVNMFTIKRNIIVTNYNIDSIVWLP